MPANYKYVNYYYTMYNFSHLSPRCSWGVVSRLSHSENQQLFDKLGWTSLSIPCFPASKSKHLFICVVGDAVDKEIITVMENSPSLVEWCENITTGR